jgi:hypothetical protein
MEVVGVDGAWRKLPHRSGERFASDSLETPTAYPVAEVLQLGKNVRREVHKGSLRDHGIERDRPPRSCKCLAETSEHCEVGVKSNASQATSAEGSQSVLVLQPADSRSTAARPR